MVLCKPKRMISHLSLGYLTPQMFMYCWGFAVTFNTWCVSMSSDLATTSWCSSRIATIKLFFSSQKWSLSAYPSHLIIRNFLGWERNHLSLCERTHSTSYYVSSSKPSGRRLYLAIGCIQPKKWLMKDIVNLKCVWQLTPILLVIRNGPIHRGNSFLAPWTFNLRLAILQTFCWSNS